MGSDRWTESHRADAFDGDVVALLHYVGYVSLGANGIVQSMLTQMRLNHTGGHASL
jgi:hypothetical protein